MLFDWEPFNKFRDISEEYKLSEGSLRFCDKIYTNPPIGAWKVSELLLLLDTALIAMSGGKSTANIMPVHTDTGVTCAIIAIHQKNLHANLIEEILEYAKSVGSIEEGAQIFYSSDRTPNTRNKNLKNRIPVNEKFWERLRAL